MDNPLDHLPHAYPYRLLDRVLELSETRGVGIKNVSANDALFSGCFNAGGTLPDVLVIEAMAQLAGLVMNYGKAGRTMALLAQITSMRFTRPVAISEQLEVVSELEHALGPLAGFTVTASVDGALVAKGELVMAGADE